jgi:hypothetical protein
MNAFSYKKNGKPPFDTPSGLISVFSRPVITVRLSYRKKKTISTAFSVLPGRTLNHFGHLQDIFGPALVHRVLLRTDILLAGNGTLST